MQFAVILVSILFPTLTLAQSDLTHVLGIPPDATIYPIPGLGFVNLNNGNLHIEIPIRVVKDRNGAPVTTSILYDNSVWQEIQVPSTSGSGTLTAWTTGPSLGEFTKSVGISVSPDYIGNISYPSSTFTCGGASSSGGAYQGGAEVELYGPFQYIDGHGTIHAFPTDIIVQNTASTPQCYGTSAMAASMDGLYWFQIMNSAVTAVWDIHGNLVFGGKDTNGNFAGAGFVDKLGRSMNLPGDFIYSTKTIHVWSNFGSYGYSDSGGELNVTAQVLSSLTLPDGRSYSFQYDDAGSPAQQGHYGSLTGITLPTGGQITIQSEVLPVATFDNGDYPDPFVVKSITTPDGTWGFTYSYTSTGALITATAPVDPQTGLASQTTCNCSPDIQNTVSFYSGTASGTPLRTVTTQYTGGLYTSGARPSMVTTTLDNGQSSYVSYTYADICTPRVASKKEYDFTGSLIRETDETYLTSASDNANLCTQWGYNGTSWSNTTTVLSWNDLYLQGNHHITDIPASVTVYGPGGCCNAPIAQTNYTYDSTPLSTTSGTAGNSVLGLPTHDDVNFGAGMTIRGNPTVISKMTGSGAFITTQTNYYNILGEVVKSVDGIGNATTLDYTDSWADASCISVPEFAYPTMVTNALGQLSKSIYNSCDGSIHSVQDQNDINAGRTGTVYTYDGLQRVTSVSLPDGGSTTTNYGGSATPEVVTSTTIATPDPTQVSTSTLDSLGRTVTTVAPSGATVQTTYDSRGRVHTVSNPYFSTSDLTYGLTTYTYDALNRTIIQLDSDGTNKQTWSYSGPTVTYTNEDGNQWQRTSDALGRLIVVKEPSGASQTATMETDYGYDTLNNLLTVTQWGGPYGTSGARSRSFNYDSLSRLLCASNPENSTAACPTTGTGTYVTGTTGYSYDADSNVKSKTDARGVTTTYSYDALNRLLSKTYSDVATPLSCYQYDSSSIANGIGRIANAWTLSASGTTSCSTTAPTTGFMTKRSILAYDPRGRILNEQQFTLATSTNGTPYSPVYTYDLAGNLLTSTSGVGPTPTATPFLFTNTFDSAGRLQTVVSNWTTNYTTNATNVFPAALFSNPSYAAFGGLTSATFGSGLTLSRTYDNRQRVISETDTGTGATAGTPGSATVTITGSEQTQ
jgi:YD repeat-containing protein